MKVKKVERGYAIVIDDGDKVDGHKPSVTVLFQSVAKACGKNALGIILTGVLIFLPAGTMKFYNGWLLMAALFVPMLVAGFVMMFKNP